MHYSLIFDAADDPFRNWWFAAGGLVLVAVGVMLAFYPHVLERFGFRNVTKRWLFRWVYFFGAVGWTVWAGIFVVSDSMAARSAVLSGDCEVLEGRVANFHSMPKEGHDQERFTVNGVPFFYSDFEVTAGFNNTASHGGPIREGLPVRVCHRDGLILRLEVAA